MFNVVLWVIAIDMVGLLWFTGLSIGRDINK